MERKIGLNMIAIIGVMFFTYNYWGLINFDRALNLDINDYYLNYTKAVRSYDFGFELYFSIFRDIYTLDFETFWIINILIMISLFMSFSYRFVQFPFYLINFIYLSTVIGTQIRYFLATFVFIFILSKVKRWSVTLVLLSLACLIHYGLFIVLLIYITSRIIFAKYDLSFLYQHRYKIIIAVISVSILALPIIEFLLPYTRFSYYVGNSKYLGVKSLSSIAYLVVLLITYLYACGLDFFKKLSENDKFLVGFSILLVVFMLMTSPIAILSGRVLTFYFILEVFLSHILFRSSQKLYFVMLCLSFMKFLPSIIGITKEIGVF
ncbi:EpsG family protein [Vibrio cyclitrophicus]